MPNSLLSELLTSCKRSRSYPSTALVYGALVVALCCVHGRAWAEQEAAPARWTLQAVQQLQEDTSVLVLDHAWRLLTERSPDYQAALSARAAAATEVTQGRAGLLPNVQAGYYRGRITGVQRALDRPAAIRESELDYDSENTYVQLRQPLLDYGRHAAYRRGVARAAVGEAEFRVVEMELATTLLETYARSAQAQEALRLQRGLEQSLASQAKGLRSLYEKNEATLTDAQEVEGRLALARADVVAAERELSVSLRELAALTGVQPERVLSPAEPFPDLPQPFPRLEQWVGWARERAPGILLAREERRVADAEVSQATSRHLPNLELVAAWTQADSENLSTLSQRSDTFSVGLNLSIPIFSGGYDTAAQSQARARLLQVTHRGRATEETVLAEVIRQHARVTGGLDRVRALEQAATAAEQSMQAALSAHGFGAGSMLDALRAQDRSFEAQRQLLEARLEVLQGYAGLRLLAGDPAWEALLTSSAMLGLARPGLLAR